MAELIDRFRALHQQKKIGALSDTDLLEYQSRLRELTHLALVAQQLGATTGSKRRFLRTAVVFSIEIEIESESDDGANSIIEQTTTVDVASRGFAIVLSRSLVIGTRVRFKLDLPAINGKSAPAATKTTTTTTTATTIVGTAFVTSMRRLNQASHASEVSEPLAHRARIGFTFDTFAGDGRAMLETALVDVLLSRFEERFNKLNDD